MVDEYRKCSNRDSLQEQLKSYLKSRTMVQTLVRGLATWKDKQRHALNGTASWQTKLPSSCFRSPHHQFNKEDLKTVKIQDRAVVQSLNSLLR